LQLFDNIEQCLCEAFERTVEDESNFKVLQYVHCKLFLLHLLQLRILHQKIIYLIIMKLLNLQIPSTLISIGLKFKFIEYYLFAKIPSLWYFYHTPPSASSIVLCIAKHLLQSNIEKAETY